MKRTMRWRLLFASTLVPLLSCAGDISHSSTVLEVRVRIVAPDGQPKIGIPLYLVDKRIPVGIFEEPRHIEICTTDTLGLCSARVEYRYGRHWWSWEKASPKVPRDALQLWADLPVEEVPLGSLPVERVAQLQGNEVVEYHAVLDAGI